MTKTLKRARLEIALVALIRPGGSTNHAVKAVRNRGLPYSKNQLIKDLAAFGLPSASAITTHRVKVMAKVVRPEEIPAALDALRLRQQVLRAIAQRFPDVVVPGARYPSVAAAAEAQIAYVERIAQRLERRRQQYERRVQREQARLAALMRRPIKGGTHGEKSKAKGANPAGAGEAPTGG